MDWIAVAFVGMAATIGWVAWKYKDRNNFSPKEILNPNFVNRHLEYARNALERQDFEAALNFCLAIAQTSQRKYQIFGWQQLFRSLNTEAAKKLELADAYVIRSDLFNELGDLEQAIADCDHAIRLMPAYHNGYLSRSWHCLSLYRYDQVVQAATTAIELTQRSDPRPYLNRSLAYINMYKLAEAEADLKHVLTISFNDPKPYRQFASLYHRQGDKEATRVFAKRAVELAQNQPNGYWIQITGYMLMLEWDKAEHVVNAALRHVTNSQEKVRLRLYKASFYQIQGHFEEAYKHYDAVIAETLDYDAYNDRAWLLAQMERLDDSLRDANFVISYQKLAQPHFFGTRGHTYFLMGRYQEALADFTRSLEIQRYHTFALLGQALCHHTLGHIEQARTTYHRLIDLDPRYKGVETLVEDFYPAKPFVEAVRQMIAALEI
jgi:tetratricopeptide (TPR) repeat protein